jgi:hypothetical protein
LEKQKELTEADTDSEASEENGNVEENDVEAGKQQEETEVTSVGEKLDSSPLNVVMLCFTAVIPLLVGETIFITTSTLTNRKKNPPHPFLI